MAEADVGAAKHYLNTGEEYRQKILDSKSAENTKRGTKTWMATLNEHIVEKNWGVSVENVMDQDLPKVLSDSLGQREFNMKHSQ